MFIDQTFLLQKELDKVNRNLHTQGISIRPIFGS